MLSTVEAQYLQGCYMHLKIGVSVKPGKDWGKPFTLKQLRRLRACVASNWRKQWGKAQKEKEIEKNRRAHLERMRPLFWGRLTF